MNSILYILSNEFENTEKFNKLLQNSVIVIAVDGGLSLARKYNIVNNIDLAIGDFDTCQNPENFIENSKILRFPANKDLTDTVLAYNITTKIFENLDKPNYLKFVSNKVIDEFGCISTEKDIKNIISNISKKINPNEKINHIFYSVSGKREDHFLSLLFYFSSRINDFDFNLNYNNEIIFHNDLEAIFILKQGNYKVYRQNEKLFSFFPLSNLTDVIVEPVEYKFPANLDEFFSTGISNIFKSDEVTIKFKNGMALLFIENKDGENLIIERI